MNTTHFKRYIPRAIIDKLSALAIMANATFDDMVTGRQEAIGEAQLDIIQGNAVSGFFPFQDGGYSVSRLYRSDLDSTYHFTEKQTDYIREQEKHCIDAFQLDNGVDDETSWDDLTPEQKEKYYEYENEWFNDGALLQFQMFVEGYTDSIFRSKKAVVIRMSINYRDEYFREKHAEDIKMTAYDVEEFMSTPNEEIIKAFTI